MPTKKTEATAAASEAAVKPSRTRKVAEPAVATAPDRPDRTMWWALAVLAAAVVFGGGYLVGHAVADDDGEFGARGRGGIIVSGEGMIEGLPMGPGHHLPGMVPFEMYPMPGMDQVPGQSDDGTTEGQGYLGIRGVDGPGAVRILEVEAGSPADEAGIEAGDRVVSFNGTAIGSMEQLADLVRATAPGTEVEMVLGGPGGGREVTVVVGARPDGE